MSWSSSDWPGEDPEMLKPGEAPRPAGWSAQREGVRVSCALWCCTHISEMASCSQVGRGREARAGGSVSLGQRHLTWLALLKGEHFLKASHCLK